MSGLDPDALEKRSAPAATTLASRATRKQKPPKVRIAELEELVFTLQGAVHTFGAAVLVLREEMEEKFGRPIARRQLPVPGSERTK